MPNEYDAVSTTNWALLRSFFPKQITLIRLLYNNHTTIFMIMTISFYNTKDDDNKRVFSGGGQSKTISIPFR